MYRARLGLKDRLKVVLLISLAIMAKYAPYALMASTATILVSKWYVENIVKKEFRLTGIPRIAIIIMLTILTFLTFGVPEILSRISYPLLYNVVSGLIGLSKNGRYNKIPKDEREKFMKMSAGELAERLAEEFKEKVASSISDLISTVEPTEAVEFRDMITRLITWCAEQAKRRSKTGDQFVKEYYTCLREVCLALFYVSEECLDEILGKESAKIGLRKLMEYLTS